MQNAHQPGAALSVANSGFASSHFHGLLATVKGCRCCSRLRLVPQRGAGSMSDEQAHVACFSTGVAQRSPDHALLLRPSRRSEGRPTAALTDGSAAKRRERRGAEQA